MLPLSRKTTEKIPKESSGKVHDLTCSKELIFVA